MTLLAQIVFCQSHLKNKLKLFGFENSEQEFKFLDRWVQIIGQCPLIWTQCPLIWTQFQISGPFLHILYVCLQVKSFHNFWPNMMTINTNDVDNKIEMTLFKFFSKCLFEWRHNDCFICFLVMHSNSRIFLATFFKLSYCVFSVDGFLWDCMPTFYVINFREKWKLKKR